MIGMAAIMRESLPIAFWLFMAIVANMNRGDRENVAAAAKRGR
jgi:hypothetical protein